MKQTDKEVENLMKNHDAENNIEKPQRKVDNVERKKLKTGDRDDEEIKLYKKRWIILLVFVLYASGSFMQWFQYSIISNIIENYYDVSAWAVKMTSVIFMITYLPLAFPVAFLMDKMSLRSSALIGSIGTAVGSIIKIFSVSETRFVVTFAGQTVVALSQLFILSVPPKIAALWFGETEVSTACSIAIYGSQFGIASGFFLSPLLVTNTLSHDVLSSDLLNMFIIIAVFTTIMALIVFSVFQAEPDLPPSPAQALLRTNPSKAVNYISGVKDLLLNVPFNLLVISNGLNNGCFSAMSTTLNQIFLHYHPNGEMDPGTAGVLIVVAGMVGSVCCGLVMDRTKKYKNVAVVVYLLAAVTMIAYAYSLQTDRFILTYALAWILGFFLLGYTPVGYEFGSELTYPESEVTVAAILNIMNMLAGILLTVLFDYTLNAFGALWSNMTAAFSLAIGTLLTVVIKSDLKRQRAQTMGRMQNNLKDSSE